MQNIVTKVVGNKLTITIDLSKKPTPSASGKTMVLASTRGNARVEAKGEDIFLGVNCYKYPEPK